MGTLYPLTNKTISMYNEFISQDGRVILDESGKFVRWNNPTTPPYVLRDGYFFQDTREEYPYE